MTLTTVGYGDITPTNTAERTYTLCCLLIGALVFGYMVSTIGSLMAGIDRHQAALQERVDRALRGLAHQDGSKRDISRC